MDCFNCLEYFNLKEKVPLILICCGNSICQKCFLVLNYDKEDNL